MTKQLLKRTHWILVIMLLGSLCTSVLANSKEYLQTKIYFPFGKSVINNQFRENNVGILLIDSVCSSLNKSDHYQIHIVGSASPEGELSFNENLSRERAEVLKNQLVAKYNFPDTIFVIKSLGANKESVESPRDLRYAEIAINTIEIAKAAPVIKKAATNTPVQEEASFWDPLLGSWIDWVLAVLIIIILIIILYKKAPILLEWLLNKFGQEGDGKGNLPNNGHFMGEEGESMYQMEETPQNRGTNKEKKSREELLKSPFFFRNPEEDNSISPRTKKVLCRLQDKLRKEEHKGVLYKNKRPIFKPFSLLSVFTKITSSRDENMKRGLKLLAKQLRCTENEAQNVLTNYDLVEHERIVKLLGFKIGIIQFIPKNIHENAPHTGGVSDAKKMGL